MKIINFKATPEFAKELDDHCKEWQITKSALIKSLIFVHIKKVRENRKHFHQMIHDYNMFKKHE
jgi:hypothetical protein